MWDGWVDSSESHVIQNCSAIHNHIDLHLRLSWGPHILGNTGGRCVMGNIQDIQAYSHLSSVRCTQTRALSGALGRHKAATERKQ